MAPHSEESKAMNQKKTLSSVISTDEDSHSEYEISLQPESSVSLLEDSFNDDSTVSSVTCSIFSTGSSLRSLGPPSSLRSIPRSTGSVSQVTDDDTISPYHEKPLVSERWSESKHRRSSFDILPTIAGSTHSRGDPFETLVSSRRNKPTLSEEAPITPTVRTSNNNRLQRGDSIPSLPIRSWHKRPALESPRIPVRQASSDHKPRRRASSHPKEEDEEDMEMESVGSFASDDDESMNSPLLEHQKSPEPTTKTVQRHLSDSASIISMSPGADRSTRRTKSASNVKKSKEKPPQETTSKETTESKKKTNHKEEFDLSTAIATGNNKAKNRSYLRTTRRRAVAQQARRTYIDDVLTSILEDENENGNNGSSPNGARRRSVNYDVNYELEDFDDSYYPTAPNAETSWESTTSSSLLGAFHQKESDEGVRPSAEGGKSADGHSWSGRGSRCLKI